MLSAPWVLISASETPAASTRWRMIETAWSSCSGVTRLALGELRREDDLGAALRSRASFGAQLAPYHLPESPAGAARIAAPSGGEDHDDDHSQASDLRPCGPGSTRATRRLCFLSDRRR